MEVDGEVCICIQCIYIIINYCEYDGVSEFVVFNCDEDCDVIEGEDYFWLIISNGNVFVDVDNDVFNSVLVVGSMGICGSNLVGYWCSFNNVGVWIYMQVIDIFDEQVLVIVFDVLLVFCVDEVVCEGVVSLVFDVLEQCLLDCIVVCLFLDQDNDGIIDFDLIGIGVLSQMNQWYVFDGNFLMGSYVFVLEVEDVCGNIGMECIVFMVVDCYID